MQNIAEMLKLNVPMAMKIAFDGLKDSEYKTRDTSIDDVGKFDKVELSVVLCNDDFIRNLNKDWRGQDHATDVLSMSQHIAKLDLPVLMLGDVVISVETAARQAEERGHTLLDEIGILIVGYLIMFSIVLISLLFSRTLIHIIFKSQITANTAEAIREAVSRGVSIVIATGKTRPAVVSALKLVDLVGKDGVMSGSLCYSSLTTFLNIS
ncbi:Endoribonuclease YBEY, chloroplastic [Canna indica]|uniref:Endoribonuclease YBEY, chloroplastic n=1 Tax=Canna indica TaxID=4628 RepID=A0AAQ3K7U5_9LILI|nr:Endoribonuclease YBEY, chloroplastic [Canna indica]